MTREPAMVPCDVVANMARGKCLQMFHELIIHIMLPSCIRNAPINIIIV